MDLSEHQRSSSSPEGQLITASWPFTSQRRDRRTLLSLAEYVEGREYFSVSELVGPTWCEFSYQYGIFGQNSLPIEERPIEVTMPSGHVIRPDKEVLVRKEKIQNRGREIHRKLEQEIHTMQVYVHTQTREDDWALRLLRLVVGLRSLLDRGCARELPVFGWVQDRLVVGIIDEIERRPLRRHPSPRAAADHSILEDAAQGKLHLNSIEPPSVAFNSPRGDESREDRFSLPREGKSCASEDEWRAHQSKLAAAKKQLAKHDASWRKDRKGQPNSSPESRTKKSTSAPTTLLKPKQPSLDFFFVTQRSIQQETRVSGAGHSLMAGNDEGNATDGRSNSQGSSSSAAQLLSSQLSRPQGFFLVDTKTRMFPAIPATEDQTAARLQTMLYKRLFDGLCFGACQRRALSLLSQAGWSRAVAAHSRNSIGPMTSSLRADPEAVPFDFSMLFSHLNLRAEAPLSEVFLQDSKDLLQDVSFSKSPAVAGLSAPLSSNAVAQNLTTLLDVVRLIDQCLTDLVATAQAEALAQVGQVVPASDLNSMAALQTELSLVYRQQRRQGRWKRRRCGPRQAAANRTSNQRRGHSTWPAVKRKEPVIMSDLSDEVGEDEDARQLRLAIQLSLEEQADVVPRGERIGATGSAAAAQGATVLVSPSPQRRQSCRLANCKMTSTGISEDGQESEAFGADRKSTEHDGSSAPRRPRKSRACDKSRTGSPPSTEDSSGCLIGKICFQADPARLSAHLDSILLFYAGKRAPRGVSEQETWKCKGCEWQEGCEWRQAKGQEKAEWAWSRQQQQRQRASDQDQAEESVGIAPRAISADVEVEYDEDDAALWDQFDELPTLADSSGIF